jgi:hypothetical protein
LRLGALRQIGRAARDFRRSAGDLARRLDDRLNGVLQPLGGEIEVLADLLIGAGKDFIDTPGEIALGQRLEALGNRSDDTRLLFGDFGALRFRLRLCLAFAAPLFLSLLALRLRVLTLFDASLFQRRVAE